MNVSATVLLFILLLSGLALLYHALLTNARQTGMALARACAGCRHRRKAT